MDGQFIAGLSTGGIARWIIIWFGLQVIANDCSENRRISHRIANGRDRPVVVVAADVEVDGRDGSAQWVAVEQVHPAYSPIETPDDLRVQFKVSIAKDSLYLEVRASDQSKVLDCDGAWNETDRVEMYVGTRWEDESLFWSGPAMLGESVRQWVFSAGACGLGGTSGTTLLVETAGSSTVYRVTIPLPQSPDSPVGSVSLPFDVAVCDLDADGSFSWVSWTPSSPKTSSGVMGRLRLTDN